MKVKVLILFTILFSSRVSSKDSLNNRWQENYSIELLQNDMKELRRDQLNHIIEKDLLEKTYSSNYNTIQLIISLILGIFAILGYLGFRGITSLKREYDSELDILKQLKSEFEVKLKELSVSQEKLKVQISSIDSLNEEQNKKIKTLEIKEKLNSLLSKNNFQRILDYVAIGLDLSPNDIEFLSFRAFALLKLRNYTDAIEAHKNALAIEPNSSGMILNLAELFLIVGQIDSYSDLVKNNGTHLKMHSTGLFTYLEAYKNFKLGDKENLTKTIGDFIKRDESSINRNLVESWDFNEFYDSIKNIEDSREKTLLINFTNYLKGKESKLKVSALLNT
jgi:tetratricopeptide (TPR) repeat protein